MKKERLIRERDFLMKIYQKIWDRAEAIQKRIDPDYGRTPEAEPEPDKRTIRMQDMDLWTLVGNFELKCRECSRYQDCFLPSWECEQELPDGMPRVTIRWRCDKERTYGIPYEVARYMAARKENRVAEEPPHCGRSTDYTLEIPNEGATIHFSFAWAKHTDYLANQVPQWR